MNPSFQKVVPSVVKQKEEHNITDLHHVWPNVRSCCRLQVSKEFSNMDKVNWGVGGQWVMSLVTFNIRICQAQRHTCA